MDAEATIRVARNDLEEALRKLGIRPGGVLLVHSSLSSLGHVDGGAPAVVEALENILGADGLLVMPAFTNSYTTSLLPGEPEPFDPATTSCRRRTGIIPDTFRQMPGVWRSRHPSHSLVARGPRAEEFVQGGERRTFDPAGPFGRYVQWGGQALFLGAGMGSNTTYHCAEDWMGLPCMLPAQALVRTAGGGVEEVEVTGSPKGCRAYYKGGGEPSRLMEAAGLVRKTMLNQAELRLAAAREIIRFSAESEEREPGFLLCRGTPHDFCRDIMAGCRRDREGILGRIAALRANGWAPGR
jgi:aminoglycoside N3'-acetyltransferase